MKILMLNNEYPPLGGGTGTVNKEIITFLKKDADIQVDLIVGSNAKNTSIEQISKTIRIIKIGLNNKNIHHASNGELIKYTIKAFFKAQNLFKHNKYDFIFAWSTIPAGFVGYLLKTFYGTPLIVRVGGPDIPGYEDRYKLIYKLITPIIKIIWKKSHTIIAKCQDEKEMILAINKNLPLHIIHNGININKFAPKTRSIDAKLKVICSARLIKRKGQDILIRAIAYLKKTKNIEIICDLVGDGDEKDNYMKLAKSLNIDNLINFRSYVSRGKIADIYNSANVFVLPSHNEGMSNAVLEAMSCALPIVVTNVGGTEELLANGENGFMFEKGNYKELASILETLHSNRQLCINMGNKSREIAKMFEWSTIGNQYVALFKNILLTRLKIYH